MFLSLLLCAQLKGQRDNFILPRSQHFVALLQPDCKALKFKSISEPAFWIRHDKTDMEITTAWRTEYVVWCGTKH